MIWTVFICDVISEFKTFMCITFDMQVDIFQWIISTIHCFIDVIYQRSHSLSDYSRFILLQVTLCCIIFILLFIYTLVSRKPWNDLTHTFGKLSEAASLHIQFLCVLWVKFGQAETREQFVYKISYYFI